MAIEQSNCDILSVLRRVMQVHWVPLEAGGAYLSTPMEEELPLLSSLLQELPAFVRGNSVVAPTDDLADLVCEFFEKARIEPGITS